VSKRALGKGLNSLIPQYDEPEKGQDSSVSTVSINRIRVNPDQPRKTFNEESLKELADSIKQQGIIQPIIVEKDGSEYNIVAGERRFRAAKIAGLFEIPVIVRRYTAEEKFGGLALVWKFSQEGKIWIAG